MSCVSDKPLRLKALLSVVLLVSAAAVPASAQGIKEARKLTPTELRPAHESGTFARDGVVVEQDSNAGITSRNVDAVVVPAPGAVTVQPAAHLSLDTLGLYDESTGGLSTNAWQGTDHARAMELFAHMPEAVPSDSLRKLVLRLLLSSTRPPQSANIQQSIFRPRVEALLQLGEAGQALRLIDLAPKDQRNESLSRLEYTAHLLNSDLKWVCDNIASTLSQPSDDPLFWRRISIFCLAKDGKEAEAQLALDLLSEQGDEPDAGFVALVDSLLGRSAEPKARFATPLSLTDAALIAHSGKDAFPEGYLANQASVAVTKIVAGNGAFAAPVREVANKRLSALHANEKPSSQRQSMQVWFGQQFSLPADKPFAFDEALKQTAQKLGGSVQLPQAYRFHALLQALGFTQIELKDPWMQGHVKMSRTTVAPWLQGELDDAVAAKHLAESILLSAIVAGQGGTLTDADDATVVALVSSLRALGLNAEARALAVEAMAALY